MNPYKFYGKINRWGGYLQGYFGGFISIKTIEIDKHRMRIIMKDDSVYKISIVKEEKKK